MNGVLVREERGFTLPELIVATVALLLLLIGATLLLRPADYTAQSNDADRRLHIAMLAQGINRYVAEHGQLPADIPTRVTAIGSVEDHYNLCGYLVAPGYLKDIPLDPGIGVKTKEGGNQGDVRCTAEGVEHGTGYSIKKERDGKVTLEAPFAETQSIKITFQPQK